MLTKINIKDVAEFVENLDDYFCGMEGNDIVQLQKAQIIVQSYMYSTCNDKDKKAYTYLKSYFNDVPTTQIYKVASEIVDFYIGWNAPTEAKRHMLKKYVDIVNEGIATHKKWIGS